MEIVYGYREDPALRASFFALSQKVFGLDFTDWHQKGFWTEKYNPCSVVIEGQVVANVSVNRIDGWLDGKERHYVQLGTVMTDPDYRGRGLNRLAMEAALQVAGVNDGVYLYAGDAVLDYYPKYGFQKAAETRYELDRQFSAPVSAQPFPLCGEADYARFCAARQGLCSAATFAPDTFALYMFYLSSFMQDCVYSLPALGALVVAEEDGDTLILHEVLSPTEVDLASVCAAFGSRFRRFVCAFTPKHPGLFTPFTYKEDDCTFFIRDASLRADMERIGSFSGITHA